MPNLNCTAKEKNKYNITDVRNILPVLVVRALALSYVSHQTYNANNEIIFAFHPQAKCQTEIKLPIVQNRPQINRSHLLWINLVQTGQ